MWELLKKLTSTRYVRLLEGEVARLRAENRALMNSILGIAGVPPLPAVEGQSGGVLTASSGQASFVAANGRPSGGRTEMAGPMRRRSWQQINKALEFEYGRKKEPSDGVTLPTARKEK